jgi:uncharacterized protein with HEPN domain
MKATFPGEAERIKHILEAIEYIEIAIQNHTESSFINDHKTVNACIYKYSIIGEATNCINRNLLAKYLYPWHQVKSFRNFVLHEYHAVSLQVIWNTSIQSLPELKKIMILIQREHFPTV